MECMDSENVRQRCVLLSVFPQLIWSETGFVLGVMLLLLGLANLLFRSNKTTVAEH
jgi:hypothetical protein